MRKYLNYFLLLVSLLYSVSCLAVSQDEKLWLGLNSAHIYNERWMTFVFAQARMINESHPWQVGLLEGGAGYHFDKKHSFWVGYRWSGHNPYNDFYQENRLFQQYIDVINLINSDQLVLRTRLEEIKRGSSSQISVKLRQRFALQVEKEVINNMKLFFYEEIFFQLHTTQFSTDKFIGENRVFLGFNLRTSKKNWWEIGYINQYLMRTPQNNQNTMSHIASFTYNF